MNFVDLQSLMIEQNCSSNTYITDITSSWDDNAKLNWGIQNVKPPISYPPKSFEKQLSIDLHQKFTK